MTTSADYHDRHLVYRPTNPIAYLQPPQSSNHYGTSLAPFAALVVFDIARNKHSYSCMFDESGWVMHGSEWRFRSQASECGCGEAKTATLEQTRPNHTRTSKHQLRGESFGVVVLWLVARFYTSRPVSDSQCRPDASQPGHILSDCSPNRVGGLLPSDVSLSNITLASSCDILASMMRIHADSAVPVFDRRKRRAVSSAPATKGDNLIAYRESRNQQYSISHYSSLFQTHSPSK